MSDGGRHPRATAAARRPFGRLSSLGTLLARARTEEEVFRTANDVLTAAGFGVTWCSPESSAEVQHSARAWSSLAAFWPEEQTLSLRIDVAGTPRALLFLSGTALSAEDCEAAELIGGQLALACEAVRVIGDLRSRNEELAARNLLAQAAGNAPGIEAFLRLGVTELMRYLGCDGLSLYLTDPQAREAILAQHQGGTAEAEQAFGRVPFGRGLVGRVAEDGEARCWYPENFGAQARPVIERMGFGTGVAVALKAHSEIVGVMNAAWRDRREIPAAQTKLMEAIGTSFAAALEAQRLTAALKTSLGELQQTQSELIQHERLAAFGEMAALVAHEIRNPLGVIYNALSCLRREPGEADRRALMEMVEQEGDRLNVMIDNLLQFARPSVPLLRRIDLEALVESGAETALANLEGTVELVVSIPEALSSVEVDPRLMRQALTSLLQNAAQALPVGGRVEVLASLEDGAPGTLRIDVKDNGRGVAPDVAQRIFEPFLSAPTPGAGLGLALARHIVRSHGGELTLSDPTPGRTTFTLRLPMRSR